MKISKKYSYYFILGLMFLCTILLRIIKGLQTGAASRYPSY